MGVLFGCFIIVSLFLLRDVFLFGSTREHVSSKLVIYSILTSIYVIASMWVVSSFPHTSAIELLKSPRVWTLTLAIHVVLWRLTVWFKHKPIRDGIWIISLAPAPMLILSLVVLGHGLEEFIGISDAFTLGVVASAVWILCVSFAVIGFRAAYRGWEDQAFVADLAEIASWTGLGILPFTGVAELAASLLK